MFARYFFIAIGIISILWTGYVAIDLIDKKEALQPSSVFGLEDGKVLIINRPNEINWDDLDFQTTDKNKTILGEVLPNIVNIKSVYISGLRNRIIIESSVNWTNNQLKELFKNAGIHYESLSGKAFESNGYTIEYHKNLLYFSTLKEKTTAVSNWNSFDKKSSATLISFKGTSFQSTEIYTTPKNTIEYITSNAGNQIGKQVNDFEIFSLAVPSNIQSYHFKEKSFLASNDTQFKSSPMFQWMDKGCVFINYKGKKVIISDFLDGQEPLNVLYDFTNSETDNASHAHFTGIQLTANFPSDLKKGFHIYKMNDFVVISEDQLACENVIADTKLEKTLSTDTEMSSTIFTNLPQLVSERMISNKQKYSKTVYKNRILETHIPIAQTTTSTPKKEKTEIPAITMNIDGTLMDFVVLSGKGNIIALTKEGRIVAYKNGKVNWQKALNGKPLGKIQQINSTFLVTCVNSINLFDANGIFQFGGSINISEKQALQEAHFYTWKGSSYVVYPDLNGELITYNSSGKISSTIPTKLEHISAPIETWVSQKKLFLGVKNDQTFKMYDAERKKEHRSFAIATTTFPSVSANELIHYSVENGNLISYNQKGIKTTSAISNLANVRPLQSNSLDAFLSSSNGNQVKIISNSGSLIAAFKVDFINIDAINLVSGNSRSYVSVVDGLENNVYLYDLNGRKLINEALEGSGKCALNIEANSLFLTTIVDSYVVQYQIIK